MNKATKEKVEKTFTTTDNLMYNKHAGMAYLIAQLESNRYLPTNDTAFKKIMASPDNINISEGILNDLAQNDPLGVLQIDTLIIETPYNYKNRNKTKGNHGEGIFYTEVDYACADPTGAQFLVELQMHGEKELEMRTAYNISERYTANYGGWRKRRNRWGKKRKKYSKYESLRPVISIVILNKSFYNDDPHPVRYLRPYDTSIGVYKKDLLMGLEIYLELDKDATNQPKNIQDIFQFFRTGRVPADAAEYLKEASDQMEKINFTPREQSAADFYIRAQMKRISEDAYVRDEGRAEEREENVAKMVSIMRELTIDEDTIAEKLIEKFELSDEDIQQFLDS